MRWLAVVGVLMLTSAWAVVQVQVVARDWNAVDGTVRRYALAVAAEDLDGALAEIAPDQRADWSEWIDAQLGNVYEVRSAAVRTPSLLARVTRGAKIQPVEITLLLDVDKTIPGRYYQATTRVPIQMVDGRPYLGAPLLGVP